MTTPAPEPSRYARTRLAELTAACDAIEVLAVTEQGALLVLVEGETPVFITHAEDAGRERLSRQTFTVCEHAAQTFELFLRAYVDENRLRWTH